MTVSKQFEGIVFSGATQFCNVFTHVVNIPHHNLCEDMLGYEYRGLQESVLIQSR